MRTPRIILCCLIISVSGRLEKARPLSETKFLVPQFRNASSLFDTLHCGTLKYQAGDYEEAARIFSRGLRSANAEGNTKMTARYLWGLGNCYRYQFRYRQALQSYLLARSTFAKSGDDEIATALDGSLSSLYSQLGDEAAAIKAAQRGLDRTPTFDKKGYRARLLILLANLRAKQGKMDEARELFQEGILEADRFGDADLVSSAWDKLGAALLLRGKLPQAEEVLLEAYRIRKLSHSPTLGSTYRNLGMLRLEQGDLRSSGALLDASLKESKSGRGTIPEWRFYQSRGVLRLAEGKLHEAHGDFRLALELVRNYRLEAPASDALRVSLEDFVEQVYDSFVETGSRVYFERPNAQLLRETFESVEENRAGSLGARLRDRKQFRPRLPVEYSEAVAQLQSAESAVLGGGGAGPRQAMLRIRESLIEMESRSGGAGFRLRPDLLRRVQRKLDAKTALLSFHLAPGISCLWAASSSGFRMYRLPGRESIAREALEFRRAVAAGDSQAEALGRRLYGTLFRALEPEFRNKSRWLLSLDEELFDLPFAALVDGGSPGIPTYLVERHSLRTISGASMWEDSGSGEVRTAGSFVGVGDPIYNTADVRWRELAGKTEASPGQFNWPWTLRAAPAPGLSRLAGSGAEIEAGAREWKGQSARLLGRYATKENVRRAFEGKPEVVHFATHVLEDPTPPASGLIALSVSNSGEEQLLGPAEIGGWNAHAGLIVLSGCSSGVGAAHPGAGLMGLTRAWLMAGARAVVATQWQGPDDVGVFFRRFYRQLQSSATRDPAGALEAAQIETIRSRDWRSKPAFWAAYFVLGNY